MDGTLNYGKYSHTKVTSKMIKEDDSEYNTYKINALPKTPVCVVEIKSIKAAIYPDKTPYLYFVKKSAKSHIFSKTYKEHEKHISKN